MYKYKKIRKSNQKKEKFEIINYFNSTAFPDKMGPERGQFLLKQCEWRIFQQFGFGFLHSFKI